MAQPIGGTVTIDARLWVADRSGNLVRDITSYVESGFVDWDSDRSGGSPMGCEFILSKTNLVTPWKDYLIPFQTLTYDSGVTVRAQMGHFMVMPYGETHSAIDERSTVTGRDLTAVLAISKYLDRENFSAASNLVTVQTGILSEVGLAKYNFPTTTKTLGAAKSFGLGTSRLQVMNHFFHRFGWYRLFMELDGTLRSLPYRKLSTSQPSKMYTEDHIVDLLEVDTPPTDKFANVIILQKEIEGGDSIQSIAREDSPTVPWSTVSLGVEIVRGPETVSDVEDQTALDLLAQSELDNAAAYEKIIKLRTLPDPNQEIYRTVDLYLTGDKDHLNGRYRVTAWRIGFTPNDALVDLTLSRVAQFIDNSLVPGQGLLDV